MLSAAFAPSARICSLARCVDQDDHRLDELPVARLFLQRLRKLHQRVDVTILQRRGNLARCCWNGIVLSLGAATGTAGAVGRGATEARIVDTLRGRWTGWTQLYERQAKRLRSECPQECEVCSAC
jgi:hypothetical protein